MAPAPLFASDDARILARIRSGDEGALVELYRTNRRPIMALVTRNSGTVDDAEDVLQDAVVTLWERVHRGTFEYRARLSTFIYATAKNVWLRRLSRLRKSASLDDAGDAAAVGDPDPLEQLTQGEEASIVRHALERLGDPCRKLLLMFYWEEKSMEEIAGALGFVNAETAKSKKYQCKKALEKLLQNALPHYD
jgi:RNA polymerase sigma factor (sigma-70 family)